MPDKAPRNEPRSHGRDLRLRFCRCPLAFRTSRSHSLGFSNTSSNLSLTTCPVSWIHLTPERNPPGTTPHTSNERNLPRDKPGAPHVGACGSREGQQGRAMTTAERPKTSISQSIRPPEEPPVDHARRDKQWGASSSPQYGHHIFEEVSHDGQPEGIPLSHRSVGGDVTTQ